MLEPLGLVGSVSRATAGSCVCVFGGQLTGGSRSLDPQPSREHRGLQYVKECRDGLVGCSLWVLPEHILVGQLWY